MRSFCNIAVTNIGTSQYDLNQDKATTTSFSRPLSAPPAKKIELCHRRVSKCSVEKTVAPDLVWCTGASCCCQPPASARCGRMSENPVIFWWIRDSLRTTRDQVCTPAIINRPSHHSVLNVGFIKNSQLCKKTPFRKSAFLVRM